jgi:very-short-patch-repair endonuclease
MTVLFNRTPVKPKRQRLRNNMTTAEKAIWIMLRSKQRMGIKFRRQFSIGPFIADFYSTKLRLVIEIDGEYHNDPKVKIYDAMRQWYIESFGIMVIRFTNHDVLYNINRVVCELERIVVLRSEVFKGRRRITT